MLKDKHTKEIHMYPTELYVPHWSTQSGSMVTLDFFYDQCKTVET